MSVAATGKVSVVNLPGLARRCPSGNMLLCTGPHDSRHATHDESILPVVTTRGVGMCMLGFL